ncbi:enoyl-CoA hydratase/carnithine racemase [Limimaricola soesokkakensis]|uniref:2,3-dehydroadipyl-CoA hydratase n=1 Tax=Limimaricola soesokkakensis TaxID=1343159 RepID=A0A1X6ZW23_9RHOB|nr:enoyl-CoA hydratase [Limimaricola soesokkakensis]PSK81350.1 enoyl-CoA hydratase/carnithine racemase [Limimaricola soesokkakensis]SLN62654.1 2,3-dehydroadipyl-CoA hydratase [Limimaricola soesokkakensis]
MTDELITERRGATLHIIFNRPAARNALTFGMYEALAEACANVPTDGSVRAVVISGAGGRAFAAGTDMTQFRGFETAADAHRYEARIAEVLGAVETCPLPTLAALNGACTGGGAAIAAACDLRIAAANLRFGFPIARTLGNCLSAANLARLSELVGAGRLREIIFTARLIEAEEARAIGLVSELLPDEAALMARAGEIADTLAGMAPLTLRATKEAMRRNREARAVEDADLIEICYMSEDFRHGMEAFLAKRKPEWRGR